MITHFKYILLLTSVLITGCREVQSQKDHSNTSLEAYLKNIDKEWHFVFKDTLNGYMLKPDKLREYLATDSAQVLSHIKTHLEKISNDSLQELEELVYQNYYNKPNQDSALNLNLVILRVGMNRGIDSFFGIYAAKIRNCCHTKDCSNADIKCDYYQAYLYELHELALNHKTDNRFCKKNVDGWEPLAQLYAQNKNFKKLIRLWELRAKNGSLGATMELFTLYQRGERGFNFAKEISLIDTVKAMKYLEIALKKEDARAFYELAEINMKNKDSTNAFKNYIISYELYLKQLGKKSKNTEFNYHYTFNELLNKLEYSFPKEIAFYKKEKKRKSLSR
jgi:hypothetical protein